MSDWQPIEMAPKDGTWILLFAPADSKEERGKAHMYVGTWERLGYNSEPTWAYGPDGSEHSFRSGVYGATHWMPLPKPPQPDNR